jgi:hypothetical protein
MKVWKRVLIKLFVFLLAVVAAAAGAICRRGYQQSTPQYTIERYLSLLIDGDTDRSYALLDQSENSATLTEAEYSSALSGKKYSLYASWHLTELEQRRDSDGNEYMDYEVKFLNAGDEVQAEEQFTVKKQSDLMFGVFDQWKVLADHCMADDFTITVPAGSEVYLDGQSADVSWLVSEGHAASEDVYRVSGLLPGNISLVIRHPALESVNTTIDPSDGDVDYTGKMQLKEAAQDACLEMGVLALRQLYSAAVTEKTSSLDELVEDCKKEAEQFVKEQGKDFNKESAVFKNASVYDFAVRYGDVTYTEEDTGAITVEMTLSYHYVVKEDVTAETGETLEDGTAQEQTSTESRSGDNTTKFTMSFYDGAWHIASMEVPVI